MELCVKKPNHIVEICGVVDGSQQLASDFSGGSDDEVPYLECYRLYCSSYINDLNWYQLSSSPYSTTLWESIIFGH